MATTYMVLTLPTEDGDDGTWDTKLNTALTSIDAHNHTSGNGALIPAAALSIDANVSMGNNSLIASKALMFQSQAGSLAAYTLGLVVKSNELYWVTNGGTEVQVTSGSTINTSILGGITGDYSTTDADLEYSDSAKNFLFYQDNTTSPKTWARISSETHFIFPPGNGTVAIGMKANASLAGDYNITWPASLPADTRRMSITSAGAVTFDGAHGNNNLVLSAHAGKYSASWSASANGYMETTATGQTAYLSLPIDVGKRIRSVTAYIYRASSSGTYTVDLNHTAAGTATNLATANAAASTGWMTVALSSIDHTVLTAKFYYVAFTVPQTGDRIGGVEVVYDEP